MNIFKLFKKKEVIETEMIYNIKDYKIMTKAASKIKNIYVIVGENINIDKDYIIIENHVKERKNK